MVVESLSRGEQLTERTPGFGLTTLTCIVIASMIGSGVFTTSGYSLAALGSPLRVLIAWLIGGVIAVCGAVAYGALAREIPLSGGEYVYLSRRLHPYAGFLAGWISLTAGFSGAIAFSALTFETYVLAGATLPSWLPERSLALAIIVAFGAWHAFAVRPAALGQNAIVAIKLAVLTIFLIVAAVRLPLHDWHLEPLIEELPLPGSWAFASALATSVMWISLSYLGFNAAVYVAAESVMPERTVPRALWLGTLLVTVVYLLLNLVFVTSAPATEIAGQPEIAATAAHAIGGIALQRLMQCAVVLGTATSVAGMLMTGARVFSRMADDGMFPQWFKSGPDVVARTVMLQVVIAAALVFLNNLEDLIQYLSTTLALSSTMTIATLLMKHHDRTRPSGVAFICAGVYCVSMLTIAVLMAIHDPRDLQAAAWTILSGTVLWLIVRSAGHGSPRTG